MKFNRPVRADGKIETYYAESDCQWYTVCAIRSVSGKWRYEAWRRARLPTVATSGTRHNPTYIGAYLTSDAAQAACVAHAKARAG